MANFKRQVSLLLLVLPEVAKESCFALHGGTAINLFVRDMPRLSVDIDLTYVPIEDRETSIKNISQALVRIKVNIEAIIPKVRVTHQQDELKLQIASRGAQIKLEVNQAIRGTLGSPSKMILCEKAQNDFDAFCAIQIVPIGQLFGGKICAGLDRQHPRDFFDIKYLLANEGFSKEIKKGFILSILSSNRPINELLFPNFIDQHLTITNQFDGMSNEPFSYEDFEVTRRKMVQMIHQNLTKGDKEFLLSFENTTPDWNTYDFERYPAVQWKLKNLKQLLAINPEKHRTQYEALKKNL